jgi:hypothetical protein
MNSRGSIMAHVLVTGVIVAVIASSLLRMTLLNYTAMARVSSGAQEKKEAEAAFNRVMTAWNAANAVCSNTVSGYSCTGTAGTCGCVCTPSDPAFPTVTAASTPEGCRVSATTVDGP